MNAKSIAENIVYIKRDGVNLGVKANCQVGFAFHVLLFRIKINYANYKLKNFSPVYPVSSAKVIHSVQMHIGCD